MALTPTEEAQVLALVAQEAALLSLASSEPAIISNLGATDVSLSDLGVATTPADADLLLIRQGTTDKSVTGAVLKTYAQPAAASTTVSGIVELATDAETQTGTDAVRAVTPAGRRSDTATVAGDPTFVDNGTKSASTAWVRGAMSAIAAAAGFVISAVSASGYIKFPSWLGNFVIEWGFISVPANSSVNVTLPLTIATPLLGLANWRRTSSPVSGTPNNMSAEIVSSTTVRIYNSHASNSESASWIAFGVA
jgi:hypothetical protein